MGISFTPDQQKVIDLHERNILVSAAAGSGKTAVLVERIVQMVSDPSRKIDIDRLLVVTFTSAAASEMRERVREAFVKKLEDDPDNEHIQKQLTLIHNAQITTISSFCLYLVKNHFHEIGIEPGFRVADQGEMKLLEQDVLGQVLEEAFTNAEDDFLHMVECFSLNGRETELEETILKLFHASLSYPWPKEWLDDCRKFYAPSSLEELEDSEWAIFLLDYINKIIEDSMRQIDEAQKITMESDGPYMYADALEQDLEILKKLQGCQTLADYQSSLGNIKFATLSRKSDPSVSVDKKECIKEIRNSIKDRIKEIKSKYLYDTLDVLYTELKESERVVRSMVQITQQFSEQMQVKKREKNMIDFSDMEHFALSILLEKNGREVSPTKTAMSYRDFYEEILIDEYQDSNLVQEFLLESIARKQEGHKNRFMVGDVKQSIYKFRLARPEIFMEKFDSYDMLESQNQRIDLHQNFRSREGVIEAVNLIFRQIMQRDIGGIVYDDYAALYLGADYPNKEEELSTELMLLQKPDKSLHTWSNREAEGALIAGKIKELMSDFQVKDKRTGEMRKVMYSDIVILLRSNQGWDEEIKSSLQEEGIPVHITSKTGYFSALEVQLVLNYLRILDNPLQDIPFCSSVLSPVMGFSEEELAMIKAEQMDCGKMKWYHRFKAYEQEGKRDTLRQKIGDFIATLHRIRSKISYTPIHELMIEIMDELQFEWFFSAMPYGEQRKANLTMLLEKAIEYEKTSYHGLFHFIRYIEQMEKYEIDCGEANLLDENANVVRIMSIHKSKGLEFPICFLAGLSKRFNTMDLAKSFLIDMDYGLGMECIDPIKRIRKPTMRKNVMALKMRLDNIGEELRILYVALTRAKEKLIMTATCDELAKVIKPYFSMLSNKSQVLSYEKRSNASSYLSLIIPSLMRNRCFEEVLQQLEIKMDQENPFYHEGPNMVVTFRTCDDLVRGQIKEAISYQMKLKKLQDVQEYAKTDEALEVLLEERFRFEYPHQILASLYTKTTVSELKKASMQVTAEELGEKVVFEEKEVVPYYPKFIEEKVEVSGTKRGSAYHKVLEIYPILKEVSTLEQVKDELNSLCESGKLSEEFYEVVDARKVLRFLQSDMLEKMRTALKKQLLFREQPFVIAIAANEVEERFPEDETILVQGIIDVYWEEDGEIVVADYKTDRVTNAQELVDRYHTQLSYYAKALTQLTGKKVKRKVIYSFAFDQEIEL